MSDRRLLDALDALACVPTGLYVMSSAFEGKRNGVLVRWVQQCASEPPLIGVALLKGHAIDPILRDSRRFGLSLIDANDKLVLRQFTEPRRASEDPFDCLPVETLVTGSPLIRRSIAALDCEVVRHFDLEADHELFVGQILAGRVYGTGAK